MIDIYLGNIAQPRLGRYYSVPRYLDIRKVWFSIPTQIHSSSYGTDTGASWPTEDLEVERRGWNVKLSTISLLLVCNLAPPLLSSFSVGVTSDRKNFDEESNASLSTARDETRDDFCTDDVEGTPAQMIPDRPLTFAFWPKVSQPLQLYICSAVPIHVQNPTVIHSTILCVHFDLCRIV